ncbi:MAG TPA: DUF4878 domain-containing protein [Rubrobacter sp.]|nr:DUF4878 domain-containing protein [Rubrobacter sp.]
MLLSLVPSACAGLSGPSETALAVYEAADEGALERLESYYSEDLRAAMEGPVGQMTGGTPGLADHLARGGILEDVEVLDEQESGDTAQVRLMVTYEEAAQAERDAGELFGEPNPAEQDLPLVREGGEAGGSWKVAASYLTGTE